MLTSVRTSRGKTRRTRSASTTEIRCLSPVSSSPSLGIRNSFNQYTRENMEQERFEAWGIVDLFGHTRLAGRISEQTIGGETFIRVDVPNCEGFHTRLFGKGAIYCMSLTDEAIARNTAKRSEARPVSAYEFRDLLADNRPQIPAVIDNDGDLDDRTDLHGDEPDPDDLPW